MLLPLVRSLAFVALVSTAAAQSPATSITQSGSPSLAGIWVLNPALTVRPGEIGFSRDWARGGAPGEGGGRSGGGRGHRGGSGERGRRRAADVARERRRQHTRAAAHRRRAHAAVAHHDRPESEQRLYRRRSGPLAHVPPDWQPRGTDDRHGAAADHRALGCGRSLVVLYDVEQGRQLRYTYTPTTNPARLLVDIRFLERGREGDEVKLTYEPPDAHDHALVSPPPSTPAAPMPASAFSSRHPASDARPRVRLYSRPDRSCAGSRRSARWSTN